MLLFSNLVAKGKACSREDAPPTNNNSHLPIPFFIDPMVFPPSRERLPSGNMWIHSPRFNFEIATSIPWNDMREEMPLFYLDILLERSTIDIFHFFIGKFKRHIQYAYHKKEWEVGFLSVCVKVQHTFHCKNSTLTTRRKEQRSTFWKIPSPRETGRTLTCLKNADVTGLRKHRSVAHNVHLRFCASNKMLGGSKEAIIKGSSIAATWLLIYKKVYIDQESERHKSGART